MVHHVVVTVVHAAAIGTVAQRFIGGLDSVFHAEHGAYPVAALHKPGLLAGEIYLLRVKDTLILDFAAPQAVVGGALRCALLFEQVYAADGRHGLALFAHKPCEYVHIVTGLLQNHWTGFIRIAPVAPHKRVGLVPVAHVLVGADRDHLADFAAADDVL